MNITAMINYGYVPFTPCRVTANIPYLRNKSKWLNWPRGEMWMLQMIMMTVNNRYYLQ